MSRQEKKTRIRMLPPRVQLQQRDALTGSYPTNVRFSTDGRTGKYPINFDDTKVVIFSSQSQNSSYSAPQNLGLQYSPLALYTFDGTIEDQSGNGYNLSLHSGSLQYTDGPYFGSQGILFDGYNSLSSSIISALQINGPITIEAFVKPNNLSDVPVANDGNFIAGMAGIGESLATNILYSIGVSGDSKKGSVGYILEKGAGSDKRQYTNANTLNTGNWYHVAVTRNGSGTNKLYLNGQLMNTFTDASYPAKAGGGNTQKLFVGTIPTSAGNYKQLAFKGVVSNLKIIDRELTANEIKSERELVFPTGILAGVGFSIESSWIQDRNALDLPTSGGISAPGNVASQVIEELPFFHFSPGQEMTPFRDSDQPAVDGKSSGNVFYATGSAITDVGEGFTSPLWSKNKIEIDISTDGSSELKVNFYSDPITGKSNSYLMGYYNFDQKKWEGIGQGYHVTDQPFRSGSKNYSELSICYGFSPSALMPWDARGNGEPDGYNLLDRGGLPIRDFGFPFDARYHATSSQTLKLSQYINEPFLLEKIVIDIEAVFFPQQFFWSNYNSAMATKTNTLGTLSTTPNQNFIPSHINTFFLLNQRKNQKYATPAAGVAGGISRIPKNTELTATPGFTYVSTGRDLVTFLNVACYNPSLYSNFTTRQINFDNARWPENGSDEYYGENVDLKIYDDNVLADVFGYVGAFGLTSELNRKIVMSGSVKSINLFPPFFSSITNPNDMTLSFLKQPQNVGNGPILITNNHNPYASQFGTNIPNRNSYMTSGRNGLGIPLTNRDYINPLNTINYTVTKSNAEPGSEGTRQLIHPNYSIKYFDSKTLFTKNPYLLLPTDELVFGWQLPATIGSVEDGAGTGDSYSIFFTGPGKVTLYGSYIREGKEYNDGTNQLLSSDSIHEVIE